MDAKYFYHLQNFEEESEEESGHSDTDNEPDELIKDFLKISVQMMMTGFKVNMGGFHRPSINSKSSSSSVRTGGRGGPKDGKRDQSDGRDAKDGGRDDASAGGGGGRNVDSGSSQ